jgi:hypothetical protein
MIRMSLEHISAIAHAELFLEPALSKNPEPRFRVAIERDLLRLAEIKLYLMSDIHSHQLTFDDLNQKTSPTDGNPNSIS